MSLIDRARAGDATALALLMTRKLKARGIEARAQRNDGLLQLRFDAARLLPQDSLLALVRRWLAEMEPAGLQRVRVFAWLTATDFPQWLVEFPWQLLSASLPERATPDRGNFNELDLAGIPERDRLAYYGALYAIAHADGVIDPQEIATIEQIVNLDGLSIAATDKIAAYREHPPILSECLAVLADADESLRFGLMAHLLDTSWANDELDPLEEAAIALAQRCLEIEDAEMASISSFVREMHQLGNQSFAALKL